MSPNESKARVSKGISVPELVKIPVNVGMTLEMTTYIDKA